MFGHAGPFRPQTQIHVKALVPEQSFSALDFAGLVADADHVKVLSQDVCESGQFVSVEANEGRSSP